MTTPYFDHFDTADIKAQLPWDYLALQGRSETLFVHASSCFESALHCWGYIRDLMQTHTPSMAALPQDKAVAKIAIIGAGVSGLLAANRLVRLGYASDNIDILEQTDRFGGKTHTVYQEGPHPNGGDPITVCEMGTCYLSPSYAPMLDDLQTYIGGNSQIDFAGRETNFRGIDTTGEFNPPLANGPVVPYPDYIISKVADTLGLPIEWHKTIEITLAAAMAEYVRRHNHFFNGQMPMPLVPPGDFLDKYGDATFGQYLDAEFLSVLKPVMQYAYEVQGYGSVEKIPALYGLMWVTPPILERILEDKFASGAEKYFGLTPPKVVTAWTQGWEQLWAQIVTIDKLNITYGATIQSITRA